MEMMIETYDRKYDDDVKPAFGKFDKDFSGAIDKGELKELSSELGYPLSDEQSWSLSRKSYSKQRSL
jgi:Ca2+-binding EF-hand superfamily protein